MINNKNKKIKFIILVLVLIIICILFPTLVLKNKDEKILKNAGINKQFIEYKNVSNSSIINDEKIKIKKLNLYTYKELYSVIKEESNEETYEISVKNNVITEPNDEISINIKDFNEENNYTYEILLNNNEIKKNKINEKSSNIDIEITKEGVNNLEINLYENDTNVRKYNVDIYYIKPYKEQFLDELSNKGTIVHFPNDLENYKKSNEFLKYSGIKNVRTDFYYAWTIYNGKNYNFRKTDEWYNYTINNNIKILPILNNVGPYMKNKKFPSTQSDYEQLIDFMDELKERYNFNEIEIFVLKHQQLN